MTDLEKIISLCKAEVVLFANSYKNDYQTVAQWMNDHADFEDPELPLGVHEEMLSTGNVFSISMYKDTPVGHYYLYDSRLDRLLRRAVVVLEEV